MPDPLALFNAVFATILYDWITFAAKVAIGSLIFWKIRELLEKR